MRRVSPPARWLTAALFITSLAFADSAPGAPAAPASADSAARTPAADTAHALPSGLELMHLVPPGQPPLETLEPENLGDLRDAFNAASDRVRVALLLSPSCPHCLHGADLIQKAFADSASTPLRVLVLWMHITHSDRQPPNSLVLARVSDPRTIQWWDPHRLLSKVMQRDYPADTLIAMQDTTGTPPPVIWNLVAMWRPGVTWTDHLPLPDFSGHPIDENVGAFRRRLGELSRGATRPK